MEFYKLDAYTRVLVVNGVFYPQDSSNGWMFHYNWINSVVVAFDSLYEAMQFSFTYV